MKQARVKVPNSVKPIVVKGVDSFDPYGEIVRLLKDNKIVGGFSPGNVEVWWIEDRDDEDDVAV